MAALDLFGALVGALRLALFAAAAVTAVAAGLDWLVRTRRIPPFSAAARRIRGATAPLFAPMERRIVRAGGLPSAAPWWTLGAVVVGGIVALTVLDYARSLLVHAVVQASQGPAGLVRLALSGTVGVLQLALLWRVLSSWIRMPPWHRAVRWAYRATDWMLAPIRSVVPPLGMIDISPLIAYVLLNLVAGFVLGR